MMKQRSVFWVINTNPDTINPVNGNKFDGQLCDRAGLQWSDPTVATMYWTHKGAAALISKLNRKGIMAPLWACKIKTPVKDGVYVIKEGTITFP